MPATRSVHLRGRRTGLSRAAWLCVALLAAAALGGTAPAQDLFSERVEMVPPEVERMYTRGLEYLVKTQSKQGTWADGYGQQPGVVGLCLLAMLAHGDDPNHGPYREPIRRSLDFLLGKQLPENGYMGDSMYNHGFATLALAEAYGMVDDQRIGPALQKAVDFLLTCQEKNPMGAWRYSPDSNDADTTVSGACFVALLAAQNAGVEVPEKSIRKALDFYRRCQTADGGFGYCGADGSNANRGAIGTLVYGLAKQSESKQYKAGARYCKSLPYGYNQYPYYYLYYMSQTMFHIAGDDWEKWNRQNIKTLQATQRPDGSWQDQFGTAFGTSAGLLSLALNYRFLPIYER